MAATPQQQLGESQNQKGLAKLRLRQMDQNKPILLIKPIGVKFDHATQSIKVRASKPSF